MSLVHGLSAKHFGAVTKSDTTVLEFTGVYVGGAGDVAIQAILPDGSDGAAVTFAGVAAGSILPVRGNRVMSTNTTATNMVWLRD